jgi:hypothetical protein
MPRPFDNIPVQKAVFEAWFKTEEFEMLEPGMQTAAMQVYDGFLMIEAQQQMEAAMQQQMTAESLGMQNAAEPQGPKPLPDRPLPEGNNLPTGNQPAEQNFARQ